jgi:hypothetical protein
MLDMLDCPVSDPHPSKSQDPVLEASSDGTTFNIINHHPSVSASTLSPLGLLTSTSEHLVKRQKGNDGRPVVSIDYDEVLDSDRASFLTQYFTPLK